MADDDLTKPTKGLYRLLGQYGEGRPERRRVEAEIKRREAGRATRALWISGFSLFVAVLSMAIAAATFFGWKH
jgi:hypothetical protein